jgi:hypothetical protein
MELIGSTAGVNISHITLIKIKKNWKIEKKTAFQKRTIFQNGVLRQDNIENTWLLFNLDENPLSL